MVNEQFGVFLVDKFYSTETTVQTRAPIKGIWFWRRWRHLKKDKRKFRKSWVVPYANYCVTLGNEQNIQRYSPLRASASYGHIGLLFESRDLKNRICPVRSLLHLIRKFRQSRTQWNLGEMVNKVSFYYSQSYDSRFLTRPSQRLFVSVKRFIVG